MKGFTWLISSFALSVLAMLGCVRNMYGEDIAAMSFTDACLTIRKAEFRGIDTIEKMVNDLMAAKRLDVLTFCWEKTTYARMHFGHAFSAMPSSRMRSEMALIYLESPATNQIMSDSGMNSIENERQAFAKKLIPILRETIPDIPVEYASISTFPKRLDLAERMRVALGLKSVEPDAAQRVWPPLQKEKQVLSETGGNSGDRRPLTAVAAATAAQESGGLPGLPYLWAGVSLTILSVATVLLFRSRKKS